MNEKLARYNVRSIKDNRRLYNVIANGNDNLFPDYLNGLYNNSVTHQSIVNDLTKYVLADGLRSDIETDNQILDLKFDIKKQHQTILYKLIHNAITLEIIKGSVGNYAEIGVFNPAQIRIKEVDRGEPTMFTYRKSWDRKDYRNYQVQQDLADINKTASSEGVFYWYDSGTFPVYYGRPYYMGGLNAIELEISIYMMHNHGAQNGMFPSMIVSMESSGEEGVNEEVVKSIQEQMTGVANAGKIGVVFSPSGGNPATFTTPNLTGLDKVYENQYAVSEAGILKSHGVPSPLLIAGLNQRNSGFSSLEEEMQWAKEELFYKIVEPERRKILKILDPIFRKIGIKGELYFQDKEEAQTVTAPTQEEDLVEVNDNLKNLTGRQLQGFERAVKRFNDGKWTYEQTKNYLKKAFALKDEDIDEWISKPEELAKIKLALEEDDKAFKEYLDANVNLVTDLGETEEDLIEQGYVIADVRPVDYDNEVELDSQISEHFVKLVSTGRSRPNQGSEYDGEKGDVQYKVRYKYAGKVTSKTRPFCKAMMRANKLYRKEDIDQMSFSGVNAGFGVRGARNYSIFQWKGGVYCHHYFERVTFVKEGLEGSIYTPSPKRNKSGEGYSNNESKSGNPRAKTLTESQADERGMKPKSEPDMVGRKPIDTPSRGRVTFSSVIENINKLWQ